MMARVSAILAGDIVRMNQWADEFIARIKPQLTSPPEHEQDWFVHHLAGFVRRGDFTTMTEVIDAAEKGDPVAHCALDLVFHEMLDASETPPASLRDYHRRVSGTPTAQRGPVLIRRLPANIAFMALVRLACQTFSLPDGKKLPATRNREQRRAQKPCGCSVVADGLQRADIDVSESRLTNLWGQQGKIAILFVDAWLAGEPQKVPSDSAVHLGMTSSKNSYS